MNARRTAEGARSRSDRTGATECQLSLSRALAAHRAHQSIPAATATERARQPGCGRSSPSRRRSPPRSACGIGAWRGGQSRSRCRGTPGECRREQRGEFVARWRPRMRQKGSCRVSCATRSWSPPVLRRRGDSRQDYVGDGHRGEQRKSLANSPRGSARSPTSRRRRGRRESPEVARRAPATVFAAWKRPRLIPERDGHTPPCQVWLPRLR